MNTKKIALGAVAVASMIGAAQAATTYTETFTSDGTNQDLDYIGWQGYYGNNSGTPTVADTYTNGSDFAVTTADYFQTKQGWHSGGKHIETMLFTSEPGTIALGDMTDLSVDIRRDFAGGSGANATARLVLEIGGSWYATAANRYSPRSAGDEATFTSLTIDPSASLLAADWLTIADPAVSLGTGAAPASAFDGSELVTNYGVWLTDDSGGGGGTAWTQVDNFSVTEVPEPSSAALLGLGGLALILRRRK